MFEPTSILEDDRLEKNDPQNLYKSTRPALRNMRLTNEQKGFFADKGALVDEHTAILGQMPLIKNIGNGSLQIGEFTVLNSDNVNSIIPILTPVKFVMGINAKIVIGKNCNINGATIIAYDSITIGDFVHIGSTSLILDTDLHPVDAENRRKQTVGEPFPITAVKRRKITIDDDVWIGYGVIILKGVHIGRGTVIRAGSVVTTDIPENSIVAGNPAKVIKRIDNSELD